MKIVLRNTQMKDLKSLPGYEILEEVGFNFDSIRYSDSQQGRTINNEFPETLQKISTFLRNSKVRGTLTMSEDIDSFLKLRERPDKFNQRPRNVEQFEIFLTEAVRPLRGHRLYRYDTERRAWFCSYVYDIDYVSKRTSDGWTDPEHVNVRFGWIELGTTHRFTLRFDIEDIRGMTVGESLEKVGWYPQSEELDTGYQKSLEAYDNCVDEIGKQFLATGVGTDDVDGGDRYWWRSTSIVLDRDGPSHVVIDIFNEGDSERRRRDSDSINTRWWMIPGPEDAILDDELPVHPMLVVFDLKKHLRLRVHISQLEEYIYDPSLGDKLVLPPTHRDLIDALLSFNGEFSDIISGKGGGAVVLCTGIPGTGKTLTAEVYAEVMKRPLYTVQCSQLGTSPDELEKELHTVFARAYRWHAILLLDEADVYVASRGTDLIQNAIVGVFLRVLEYYRGVMFLTTNRSDLIDDAVASRCLARIDYGIPSSEDTRRLWQILSKVVGVSLTEETIDILVRTYADLTGRDIKNLLKLAKLVTKGEATLDTFKLVKQFKPTR